MDYEKAGDFHAFQLDMHHSEQVEIEKRCARVIADLASHSAGVHLLKAKVRETVTSTAVGIRDCATSLTGGGTTSLKAIDSLYEVAENLERAEGEIQEMDLHALRCLTAMRNVAGT